MLVNPKIPAVTRLLSDGDNPFLNDISFLVGEKEYLHLKHDRRLILVDLGSSTILDTFKKCEEMKKKNNKRDGLRKLIQANNEQISKKEIEPDGESREQKQKRLKEVEDLEAFVVKKNIELEKLPPILDLSDKGCEQSKRGQQLSNQKKKIDSNLDAGNLVYRYFTVPIRYEKVREGSETVKKENSEDWMLDIERMEECLVKTSNSVSKNVFRHTDIFQPRFTDGFYNLILSNIQWWNGKKNTNLLDKTLVYNNINDLDGKEKITITLTDVVFGRREDISFFSGVEEKEKRPELGIQVFEIKGVQTPFPKEDEKREKKEEETKEKVQEARKSSVNEEFDLVNKIVRVVMLAIYQQKEGMFLKIASGSEKNELVKKAFLTAICNKVNQTGITQEFIKNIDEGKLNFQNCEKEEDAGGGGGEGTGFDQDLEDVFNTITKMNSIFKEDVDVKTLNNLNISFKWLQQKNKKDEYYDPIQDKNIPFSNEENSLCLVYRPKEKETGLEKRIKVHKVDGKWKRIDFSDNKAVPIEVGLTGDQFQVVMSFLTADGSERNEQFEKMKVIIEGVHKELSRVKETLEKVSEKVEEYERNKKAINQLVISRDERNMFKSRIECLRRSIDRFNTYRSRTSLGRQ